MYMRAGRSFQRMRGVALVIRRPTLASLEQYLAHTKAVVRVSMSENFTHECMDVRGQGLYLLAASGGGVKVTLKMKMKMKMSATSE